MRPLKEFDLTVESKFAPVPYLQIQSANDTTFPRGRRYYWKAQFLRELTEQAIDTLLVAYAGAPSSASLLALQQVGGVSRVFQNPRRPT